MIGDRGELADTMEKHQALEKESERADDQRKSYEAPELKDLGPVTEVTETGATDPGADGIYS